MSEIVDRLQPPMNSVVMATWYRTLGINSIHTGVEQVKEFIKAPDNPYGGELKEVHNGFLIQVHQWRNVSVSKPGAQNPITFNAWIYGRGVNTVFTRVRFWDLHLVRSQVEKALDLEPGSLKAIDVENIEDTTDRISDSPLIT